MESEAVRNYFEQSGFMDDSSLERVSKNDLISEEDKLAITTREFESIFLRDFLKKGLDPAIFNSEKKTEGYKTFVPELLAHALAKDSPFKFANSLQCEIQTKISS